MPDTTNLLKPFNPLDRFQSYSVQYVMLACRTTVTAKLFSDQKNAAKSMAAIDSATALGEVVKFDGGTSDIYLVLDTRRFSQFTVDSLKYDVYVNGLLTGPSAMPENLAADLSMTVTDSVGISFANFMQWLIDEKMKTNYDGIVFMLRTIFVGHNADGTSETVLSEMIPMHLNRMDIDLNFAKGTYTLEFMPNMNFDVIRYSRFLTIGTATTYWAKTNKLGEMVQQFEDRLNELSKDYFNKVKKAFDNAAGSIRSRQPGRMVQYQITIPTEWNNFIFNGPNEGTVSETLFAPVPDAKKPVNEATTASSTSVADSFASSHPSETITKVLTSIFKQCKEIAEHGNFGIDGTKKDSLKFFKYIVGITSSEDQFKVHVDVVEFEVPNIQIAAGESEKNRVTEFEKKFFIDTKDSGGRPMKIPKDTLEWDYIFTGKNDSILAFDLKIQEFQMLLAQSTRIGDGAMDMVSGGIDPREAAKKLNDDSLLYLREYDPLVLPLDTDAAIENFSQYTQHGATKEKLASDIGTFQRYRKNMSMFYAGSPIVATMTIKGNPLIMHKFNLETILNHELKADNTAQTTTSADTSSKAAYRKTLENEILGANKDLVRGADGIFRSTLTERSYAISPVFAKVNIFGPAVDPRTNIPDDNQYTRSVLSENYYVVFKVTNTITQHMFTQDLELYAHNVFGQQKITKA